MTHVTTIAKENTPSSKRSHHPND
ncbi:BnaC05g10950D [Brassica napus]|uniref:BnaC05g10950D protein n=1 Tax=Brassica napus TaxID=3708 RepID=A0A078HUS7_BRANA|nr:BnaC05g10950D [Brassica napus]